MTPLADQLAQIIRENVTSRSDRLNTYIEIGVALGFNPKLVRWFGSVYCFAIILLGVKQE